MLPPPAPRPLRIWNGQPIRPGASAARIRLLQAMLAGLTPHFANLPAPLVSGQYDEPTTRAVTRVQLLAGLPPTGETDARTWNLLAELFEAYADRPTELR